MFSLFFFQLRNVQAVTVSLVASRQKEKTQTYYNHGL